MCLLPPVFLPQSLGRLLEDRARSLEVWSSVVKVIELAVPLQDLVDVVPHDPHHLLDLDTGLPLTVSSTTDIYTCFWVFSSWPFLSMFSSAIKLKLFSIEELNWLKLLSLENSCEKSDMEITIFTEYFKVFSNETFWFEFLKMMCVTKEPTIPFQWGFIELKALNNLVLWWLCELWTGGNWSTDNMQLLTYTLWLILAGLISLKKHVILSVSSLIR